MSESEIKDAAKHYVAREEPLEAGWYSHNDIALDDGCILRLECSVSGVEFVGTPRYALWLVSPEDFEMTNFLAGSENALLSEIAYRSIMGKVKSSEDFYRLREQIGPQIEKLGEALLDFYTLEDFIEMNKKDSET